MTAEEIKKLLLAQQAQDSATAITAMTQNSKITRAGLNKAILTGPLIKLPEVFPNGL